MSPRAPSAAQGCGYLPPQVHHRGLAQSTFSVLVPQPIPAARPATIIPSKPVERQQHHDATLCGSTYDQLQHFTIGGPSKLWIEGFVQPPIGAEGYNRVGAPVLCVEQEPKCIEPMIGKKVNVLADGAVTKPFGHLNGTFRAVPVDAKQVEAFAVRVEHAVFSIEVEWLFCYLPDDVISSIFLG
eukprot:7342010-Prymnesium_polylepis.1